MSSPQPTAGQRHPDPRELAQALQRLEDARLVLRLRVIAVERLLEAMR